MVWYRFDKKQTTNDLLKLSIGWLKKHNYLKENTIINGGLVWNRTYGWGQPQKIGSVNFSSNFIGENRSITLTYTYRQKEDITVHIPVECSFPYFGGKRYWFLCPNCKRKVAFLYGGKYFWCRHCQNLSYPTQQIDYMSRMLEKSRKCEARVLENGCKKRWVHGTTLEKYLEDSEYYEALAWMEMYKMMRKKDI